MSQSAWGADKDSSKESHTVSSTMGFGMVSTRSGFDSDHLANHQRSLCKTGMKYIAEFIRDLTVLFWWVLPVTAVNMRFYCLIFARIVIYIVEATAFYSLTVTILAGTEDEVGFLVELTRLVLCTAAEQMETRVKRETEDWEGLVQRVNDTNSKLAGLLKDLFQTTTKPSLTYLTNVSTAILELAEDNDNRTLANDINFPDFGLSNQSVSFGHDSINTYPMEFDNDTSLVEHIYKRNSSGIELGPGGNITNGYPVTTYTTGGDGSDITSFLHRNYSFEFCTQMEDLTNNQTTVACVSGLAVPLCTIGALILTSSACGYMLARIGQTTFRRQRRASARAMGNDPVCPTSEENP